MSDERTLRDNDAEDSTSASDDAASSTSAAEDSAARPSGKRATRRPRSTESGTARSATAVADRPAKAKTAEKVKSENIFKRLRKFLREVVAELRKVIWPNRKQMITYTSVVLIFVVFMVAFIGGIDVAFIKGVNWLFG